MGRLLAILLAGALLALPPQRVDAAPSAATSSQKEPEPGSRRLWLILGGTVAGVTGMWAALYRRGKK